MKEYNKLFWFDPQETLQSEGLWSLILNCSLMSPSWMTSWMYLIWCNGCWLDLDLNWRKIPTLIWRSRNVLDFWGSKGAFFDLEITLYFDRMLVGLFSLNFYLLISYKKLLFIGNLIAFDLEFSLNIYWELIMNYVFNLVFHLIRTFHMSLFFWRYHIA